MLDDFKYKILTSDGRIPMPKEITKEAYDSLLDSFDKKGVPYTVNINVRYEPRGGIIYKVQTNTIDITI